MLSGSPPGRSSTLPPLHQATGSNRPRTHSITKRGREALHKKKNSRGSAAEWLRRVQNDGRKAMSAEPSADFGKRWEDLIDAADQAASAAGDVDEDRTPVSLRLDHCNNVFTDRLIDATIACVHSKRLIAPILWTADPYFKLSGLTTAASADATIKHHRYLRAIPIGGKQRERIQFSHGRSWPDRFIADIRIAQHSNLLCCL